MLIVACELPHDAMLRIVGILILVYQHVGKLRGILCQHLGMILKQQVSIQQYIVKVHRPSLSAAFLIAQVYLARLGHLGLAVVGHSKSISSIHLGCHEAVLGIRYATLDHAGLVHLIVELHLLDDALEQTLRVGLVIDGEVGSKAYMLSLGPQYAQKHAVEGAHPQVASPVLAHPTTYAFTHLACRLIGKCECQYAPRLQAQFHQVGHLIGEHTGLARPCTSNHQRGSIIIGHSSQLALIEFVSYILHFLFSKNFYRSAVAHLHDIQSLLHSIHLAAIYRVVCHSMGSRRGGIHASRVVLYGSLRRIYDSP